MAYSIKTVLEGFDPPDLSNARTVILACLDAGYSAKDLIDYVDKFLKKAKENQMHRIKAAKEVSKLFPCPECANQMVLQPVIAVKGYENRFGWKSVLRCYSCGHEEFFLETMDSKVKQLKDIQVNK